MTAARLLAAAVLAAAPLVLVAPAGAGMHACTHDASKLCPHVQPGKGRVQKCLKDHEDKISTACDKILDNLKD